MKTKVSKPVDIPTLGTLAAAVQNAADAPQKASRGPRTRVVPPVQAAPIEQDPAEVPQSHAPPLHDPEHGAMTQTQFCERYQIDRVTLYHLRKRGEAPDILLIGRKVLITYAAAREWERRMIERKPEASDAAA